MQCRDFLNQHPQLKVVEGEDTARSAEAIKNGNLKGHAAICSKIAAERYGMKAVSYTHLIHAPPVQTPHLSTSPVGVTANSVRAHIV